MTRTIAICLVLSGCVADGGDPTDIESKLGHHGPVKLENPNTHLQPGDDGDGSGSDVQMPSSVPSDPIDFQADNVFTLDSGTTNYVVVPSGYDPSHQTPEKLLVWLHGCGGYASGDIYKLAPELQGKGQDWIAIAVGGREGGCWDPDSDMDKVSAALDDIKSHFNIQPNAVVLGGYSSGGDLGYRMIFDHTKLFAGLIAENTSPFRDTGATQAQSLAAASWKINILHLAHLQDQTYPIAGVRAETDAVKNAGFPLTRIERDGAHYDDNTDSDFETYLLPAMDAGWLAP
ncbi:MAG: hypothetical protein QM831_18250 [Kofleriaceae bacterium]